MLAHLVLLFTRLSSALGLHLEINMHALVLQLLRALVDSNTLPLTCWHDLGESVKLGIVVNVVPSKLSGFHVHLERLLATKNIGRCRNPNLSDMGSHLVGIDAKHLKNQFNAAGERIYDHDIVMAALNGLSSDLVMNTTVIFACETPICLQEFRAQLLGAETIIESGMLSLTSQLHALMVQYESESVFKVAWNFSS
ncbi:hypothetical protein L3X38_017030 [Prunus dulcis]|uniref:Secreted protein n=1 Tax=Prunus dulcis TaxID=3755 RepID=A0AAD4W820_PRUDU|nr:hypothetical protein L3X38_017030 [Prunus dulcis]